MCEHSPATWLILSTCASIYTRFFLPCRGLNVTHLTNFWSALERVVFSSDRWEHFMCFCLFASVAVFWCFSIGSQILFPLYKARIILKLFQTFLVSCNDKDRIMFIRQFFGNVPLQLVTLVDYLSWFQLGIWITQNLPDYRSGKPLVIHV